MVRAWPRLSLAPTLKLPFFPSSCKTQAQMVTQLAPQILAPAGLRDYERVIAEWVAALDADALARRYEDDGGAIVLPRLLPETLVTEMAKEGRALAAHAVRKHALGVRKAGAVCHFPIVREAPALHALHQSPALLSMFARVTGVALEHRDRSEAHASALYSYTERGDFMDWHYDECGCEPGDSFSTVIGLVDSSSAALEVETHRERRDRAPLRQRIRTVPGTFAFFCGTRAYHRVTPLAEGEERLTFAFTYIKQGRKPGGIYNFRMKLGNALVYFGLGHLFERRPTAV
jgi:hypothetical protein